MKEDRLPNIHDTQLHSYNIVEKAKIIKIENILAVARNWRSEDQLATRECAG